MHDENPQAKRDTIAGEAVPIWRSAWSRPPDYRGGLPFSRLIQAFRAFLSAFAGAGLEADAMIALTRALKRWTAILERAQVDESARPYGQRADLDGRGQASSPTLCFTRLGASDFDAEVIFDRFFLGSNGAAHGGAIAYLFDEAAGLLTHLNGRPTARTAYLNTRYRSIAPIDVPLRLSGRIEREEGRKRFLRLELRYGALVCAECDVLMVELKAGQS